MVISDRKLLTVVEFKDKRVMGKCYLLGGGMIK